MFLEIEFNKTFFKSLGSVQQPHMGTLISSKIWPDPIPGYCHHIATIGHYIATIAIRLPVETSVPDRTMCHIWSGDCQNIGQIYTNWAADGRGIVNCAVCDISLF